jgi:hypothetical protein
MSINENPMVLASSQEIIDDHSEISPNLLLGHLKMRE